MSRYDAGGDARGALGLALLQQEINHNKAVKEMGGATAFLVDWMGKHPDPTKVGDFVSNLLCVPSGQVQQLLKAGEALPPGFKDWRQKCYDTYRATLPIAEWKQLAKHPEMVPSAEEIRAAKDDPAKLTELKERAWGASLIISEWTLMGIMNIDIDTPDLHPKGKGIQWELFESTAELRGLAERLRGAMEAAGEIPRWGNEIYRAHDVKKEMLTALQAQIAADTKAAAGSEGYGQGYGGAQVTQGRATPGLLSVRLKE